MGYYNVDSTDGSLRTVAGATVYADCPIGTVLSYAGVTAALPVGWMLCAGQALSRTTYKELFMTIGTSFGVGDGATTFNIPDLRECVPVGAGSDNTTYTMGAHDTYSLGDFKDDQFQGHWHRFSTNGNDKGKGGMHSAYGGGDGPYDSSTYPNGIITPQSMENMGNVRYGTTTHGKQVGVYYIIKVLSSAVPTDLQDIVLAGHTNTLEIKYISLDLYSCVIYSAYSESTGVSSTGIISLEDPRIPQIASGEVLPLTVSVGSSEITVGNIQSYNPIRNIVIVTLNMGTNKTMIIKRA